MTRDRVIQCCVSSGETANRTRYAARRATSPMTAEAGLDVNTIRIAARMARLANTKMRLVTRVRRYASVSRFSMVPDAWCFGYTYDSRRCRELRDLLT